MFEIFDSTLILLKLTSKDTALFRVIKNNSLALRDGWNPRNLVASRRVVYCWTSNFGFTMCWGFWFAGVAWHVWKCQNFKNPRGHIFVTSLLFTQKSEEFLMRIDELDDCFLWWRKKVPSHESCFLIWEPKKWTFLAAHPMNFGELHHYALAPSFSIATAFHFFSA